MTTLEDKIRLDFESEGGLDALVADILSLSQEVSVADRCAPGEFEPSVDFRIQYHDGCFYWYTGDFSVDQDHRGHWGASSVIQDMTAEDARSVAEDLLDQVIESTYQERGN